MGRKHWRMVQVMRFAVLTPLTLSWFCPSWVKADPPTEDRPAFDSRLIDGLVRGDPLELASVGEGAVLVVWGDGSARTYWPNGRSRDEILPLRFTAAGLPPLPASQPDLGLYLFSRPPYTPTSPWGTLIGVMGVFLPWDHTPRGEDILPSILDVDVRAFNTVGFEPRFNGKAPSFKDPPFQVQSCFGGGAVLLEDGQLSVRFVGQPSFTEFTTRALLPGQAKMLACERFEDALHVVVDVDPIPEQSRDREIRLTEDGEAEIVLRAQRRTHYPDFPEGLAAELKKLGERGDLSGCEAHDETGSTFFAWYRDESVKTLSASTGGEWVDVGHFEGSVAFSCQEGGRGVYAASVRGLYLVEPAGSGTPVVGKVPALLGHRFVGRPRTRGPADYRLSTVPARVQLLASYDQDSSGSSEALGQGGGPIFFTDERLSVPSWRVTLALRWDLDTVSVPYSPRTDDRSRLELMATELTLTHAVAAPVAVYPGLIQRRASEEVWDALNRVLQQEGY